MASIQIPFTFPIAAAEIAAESMLWLRYHLRAALIEAKMTPDTPLDEIVASYRALGEAGLLIPELFGFKVAAWCGYVLPEDRPEAGFDAAAFEVELRSAGASELADWWQSDPKSFEHFISQGHYCASVQFLMSLN